MNKPAVPRRYYPLFWLLQGLSFLPLRVLYGLAWVIYGLAFRLIGYRRKVVEANLRHAYPQKTPEEVQALVEGFYRHFSWLVVEILKLSSISREDLLRRVRFENPELVLAYLNQGRPVMMMGGHYANWEWMTVAVSAYFNCPTEGVYKPLSNPFFEAYMYRMRSRFGLHLIRTKDTLREFVRRKHLNRLSGFLSDQTPPGGEIQYWTSFMRQEAPFFTGSEKLANSFRCPVLFIGMAREGRGYFRITCEVLGMGDPGNPANPKDGFPLTEVFARKVEAWIDAQPTDYLWSHRRWKNKRTR